MLVVLKKNVSENEILTIKNAINSMGIESRLMISGENKIIGTTEVTPGIDDELLRRLGGIQDIFHSAKPYKLASRDFHPADTIVKLGDYPIGDQSFTIIAGPCSVESEEQIMRTTEFLASRGIKIMRGGAYKPRSSPYSFQGLGKAGLKLLSNAAAKFDMKIVTEAMDPVSLMEVDEFADMIQIGSRNMQNFSLLKAAGKLNKPVLLKRGFSATLEELLLSAEYILSEGNGNVVLCERGVRTFDSQSRNMLDINAVPALKELTHLPVLIDPSHATGNRDRIIPLSRAALAVGADGIMVEVHPQPDKALSDGPQSLSFDGFDQLLEQLKPIARALNTQIRGIHE
ncbi:MAG: 3-deoxy-7-phosphoheptulonate synthase [Calditrichaceae bacterium]